MEEKSKKIIRLVIQLLFVLFFLFMALLYTGLLNRFGYLLIAIVMLPIRQWDALLEKHRITFGTRIFLAVLILVIVGGISGGSESSDIDPSAGQSSKIRTSDVKTAEDPAEEVKTSGVETTEEPADEVKTSDVETPEEPAEELKSDETPEEPAAEVKGSSAETTGDKESVDITGTWEYVEERPVDVSYTFNSDGTWKYSGDGSENDAGTYRIADGKTLILENGSFMNSEFKIISKKEIEDAWGYKLKRK